MRTEREREKKKECKIYKVIVRTTHGTIITMEINLFGLVSKCIRIRERINNNNRYGGERNTEKEKCQSRKRARGEVRSSIRRQTDENKHADRESSSALYYDIITIAGFSPKRNVVRFSVSYGIVGYDLISIRSQAVEE